MTNHSQVSKYLDRYVHAESRQAARWLLDYSDSSYKRVLCVPVFDEDQTFLESLASHPAIHGTLLILVVNAPDNAGAAASLRTRGLLERLKNSAVASNSTGSVFLANLSATDSRLTTVVMDHCSETRTLPAAEGVGLARKLGNDVALELWREGRIDSAWLYQTDGDATLPDNYFNSPTDARGTVAQHLNFEHVKATGTSPAQSLYDLKLDYYVAGLAYAGSPYCHYSLGSAMVIHAKAYALVRGYPKRSAGEDFYLLNKLAKIGTINFDPSRTVTLRERLSTRVPFGTGPGVARFNSLKHPHEATEYYAPACFHALRLWLAFMEKSASSRAGDRQFNTLDAMTEFTGSGTASDTLLGALEQLNLTQWCQTTIRQNDKPSQALHQLHIGMDALKTLRLIHAMRDSGFGNVTAGEARDWMHALPNNLLNAHTRLGSNRHRGVSLGTT